MNVVVWIVVSGCAAQLLGCSVPQHPRSRRCGMSLTLYVTQNCSIACRSSWPFPKISALSVSPLVRQASRLGAEEPLHALWQIPHMLKSKHLTTIL